MSELLERCPVCQQRWKSARAQTCMGCRKQSAGFTSETARAASVKGQAARRGLPVSNVSIVTCPRCRTRFGGQLPKRCTGCLAPLPGGRAT